MNDTATLTQLPFFDGAVNDLETTKQPTKQTTLVVIDATVDDYTTLLVGLQLGITAAIIEPQVEGLTQITQLLSQGNYQRLVIVAHGKPGKIHLGKTLITSQTLKTHWALLSEWAVDEIVLCSCQVGADEIFIQQLADQTGSRIIASRTHVGMGNWMTEATTIFQADTLKNYHHTLNLTWNTGLTLPNGSPEISGQWGLEINGNFLYVTDPVGNNIDIYNINPTTGAITYNTSFGSGGSGVNQFNLPLDLDFFTTSGGQTKAYVPDRSNRRIVVMTVDSNTGQLTWDAGLTLPNNSPNITAPYGLEINGNFLYVTDIFDNNIDIYNINPTTGAITYNSSFGSAGSGVNQFGNPLDLEFFTTSGGQTKAYVPDRDNRRIVVLDKAPANTAPTLTTPTAISYVDTVNNDIFTAQTGTLTATDPDSGQTLTYGIIDGTVSGTTVTKVGTYGTLTLDSSTGEYSY